MVPWPVAFLAILYAVIATASAASVWKIVIGASGQVLAWPVSWLGLSVAAMLGLALLKPWARRVAIVGLVAIVVVMLAIAALLVMARRPLSALLATVGASVHVVLIRYLRRPSVRAFFEQGPIGSSESQ